jgi:probable rRNA maturation factor
MSPNVEVQFALEDADEPPDPERLVAWAAAALEAVERPGAAITLRVVDAEEGRALNRDFRGRDYATNVLSFPFAEVPPEAMAELGAPYIGDLAICAPVVAREAAEQDKAPVAHWAHMVVHGVLHLAGHDHRDEAEAEAMEARERTILAALGFADPYAAESAEPVATTPDGTPDV